jgi:hypothetical protein
MTTTTKILGALFLSAATMMPQTVVGTSLNRQKVGSELSEFAKFLPPLDEVPWLNARSRTPTEALGCLPDAGTFSALLLIPKPVTTWASLGAPSDNAGSEIVGM